MPKNISNYHKDWLRKAKLICKQLFNNGALIKINLFLIYLQLQYPGSTGSLGGEINERRERRASGHIGCKSHFHT
jgi:hypothetical protein